jgi:hypothetical protein
VLAFGGSPTSPMRPLSAAAIRRAAAAVALPDAMIVVPLAVVREYSRRKREFATDKAADVVSLVTAGRSRVLAERSRAR